MQEVLRLHSAIDRVNPGLFLPHLSKVDLKRSKSEMSSFDCDHPMFYWIFKNVDFERWRSDTRSHVLWLSGPPECNIHWVSSYILDQKKNISSEQNLVLYFHCSAEIRNKSILITFVHTLLSQVVDCSPASRKELVFKSFLHALLDEDEQPLKEILREILKNKDSHKRIQWNFDKDPSYGNIQAKDPSYTNIQTILDTLVNGLWSALGTILTYEQQREVLVVIDGLDQIEDQGREFIKAVHKLIIHLPNRVPKFKALLTSRPLAEIKEIFSRIPCIEYDRERKGLA
jgi:ankyrin repeat domain-containing protein 50